MFMDKDIKDLLETVIFIKERVEQLPSEDRVREPVLGRTISDIQADDHFASSLRFCS